MRIASMKAKVGDEIPGGYKVIDIGFWQLSRGCKTYYYVCEHECGATRRYRAVELFKDKRPCKKCQAGKLRMGETSYIIARAEYQKYKSSAPKRGLEFSITQEEFFTLVFSDCVYCGRPPQSKKTLPSNRNFEGREETTHYLNGVDRYDNSRGYVSGNCVPACWECNRAKGTMGAGNWEKMVTRWSEHLNRPKEYLEKAAM